MEPKTDQAVNVVGRNHEYGTCGGEATIEQEAICGPSRRPTRLESDSPTTAEPAGVPPPRRVIAAGNGPHGATTDRHPAENPQSPPKEAIELGLSCSNFPSLPNGLLQVPAYIRWLSVIR